jgi:hypothetical protein
LGWRFIGPSLPLQESFGQRSESNQDRCISRRDSQSNFDEVRMQATLSAREVHELKQAPAVEGVLPVFHHRWSPRSYSEREVSAAVLKKVFEAARWAPSSSNEQPWRYVMGAKRSEIYDRIFTTLVEGNQK